MHDREDQVNKASILNEAVARTVAKHGIEATYQMSPSDLKLLREMAVGLRNQMEEHARSQQREAGN